MVSSNSKTETILASEEVRVRDILDPPSALYIGNDTEIFEAMSLKKLQEQYAPVLDGIRPADIGNDEAALKAWRDGFSIGYTLWEGGMQGNEELVLERAALKTKRDLQTAIRNTMEEEPLRPVVDIQIFKGE